MNTPSTMEKLLALGLLFVALLTLWFSLGTGYLDLLAKRDMAVDLLLDEAALLEVQVDRVVQQQAQETSGLNDLLLVGKSGSGILKLQELLAEEARGQAVTLTSLEPLGDGTQDGRTRLRVRFTASISGVQALLHGLESRGTGVQPGPLVNIEMLTVRQGLSGGSKRDTRPLDCEMVLSAQGVSS